MRGGISLKALSPCPLLGELRLNVPTFLLMVRGMSGGSKRPIPLARFLGGLWVGSSFQYPVRFHGSVVYPPSSFP
jgi:hypothetical protein